MKEYVSILDDFVDQLYVDEELDRNIFNVGICQKDSECDRQRECVYRGQDSENGRCMGWPEHDQERIFLTSLKENEKEGAACDHDNQQYVCRGHRECMEG